MILVVNIRGLQQRCGEVGVIAAEYGKPHFLYLIKNQLNVESNKYMTPLRYVVKVRAYRTNHSGGHNYGLRGRTSFATTTL